MTVSPISRLFSIKMAMKMAIFWITFVLSIIGSHAAGELTILHSPKSLRFSGTSKTQESVLKEIFSASLGLSVEENTDWNGLFIVDPFNTPEAVVEVFIDGVDSLGSDSMSKLKQFPLMADEYEPDTYEAVRHRIKQRFTNGGNILVNVKLSEPDELMHSPVFGKIGTPKVTKQSLQHLKYSIEEDYQFLAELEALKAITAQIKGGVISADNIVDFYNFRFSSLHALSDFHGPDSLQTKEAKKLLSIELQKLSDAFVDAYEGSVLVTAVATDVAHTRRTIRAAELKQEAVSEDHSKDGYSDDYPAIFNIILWFSVVFTFTLIAIVYAIMDMDPGRDSIIYRMTSTRMKKDN